MKINDDLYNDLYWDGEEAYQYLPRIKGMSLTRRRKIPEGFKKAPRKMNLEIREQMDVLKEYQFTYKASRHEEWWLLDSLGPFYDEQWIDDVVQIIKGGKEASVYLCRANPSAGTELLAAKVYRPRSLRNLRKDHIYREGRARLDADGLEIIDERQHRAINRRTAYGQELMHTSWIEHEYRTLQVLSSAGCNVPKPHASDHNAILMDFIGDEQTAAPTLNNIHLDYKQAQTLFERVIENIDLMLKNHRVHGDLSAYNILYFEGEITLIDFPQAINPNRNPNAFFIFQRDIKHICDYFIGQGVKIAPTSLAYDLWQNHGYSIEPNILWEESGETTPGDSW
jgi:RIO kinase 1